MASGPMSPRSTSPMSPAIDFPSYTGSMIIPSSRPVSRIAKSTAELVGAGPVAETELDERYHAGVYGIPDEQTLDAIRTAARFEGMITDPVYEGKSMAGLIDLVRTGEIAKDSNVLYAHLGGQPAINAYTSVLG